MDDKRSINNSIAEREKNNPSSFYMFWMKFDWKKWAGRLIGRPVIYRVMTMEYARQMMKQLQSLSHYVPFDAIFSRKCVVQKSKIQTKNVWADDHKRIRRIFFHFQHTPTETNIIKNILPVFFSSLVLLLSKDSRYVNIATHKPYN